MNSDSTIRQRATLTTNYNCGDILRILLYPDAFTVYDPKHPLNEVMYRVWDEYRGEMKCSAYPSGKVIEIFKNRKDNKEWITIYNRMDGFCYSVPKHNVLEKIA